MDAVDCQLECAMLHAIRAEAEAAAAALERVLKTLGEIKKARGE